MGPASFVEQLAATSSENAIRPVESIRISVLLGVATACRIFALSDTNIPNGTTVAIVVRRKWCVV